jgi:hypothetical protein
VLPNYSIFCIDITRVYTLKRFSSRASECLWSINIEISLKSSSGALSVNPRSRTQILRMPEISFTGTSLKWWTRSRTSELRT